MTYAHKLARRIARLRTAPLTLLALAACTGAEPTGPGSEDGNALQSPNAAPVPAPTDTVSASPASPANGTADTIGASTVPLTSIVVSPATVSLAPGKTQKFTVRGKRADGSTIDVTPTYTANGGTMSSSGVYTAGAKEGTYRIIVAAGGKVDTSTVTVGAVATSVGPLPTSGSLLWNGDGETGGWPSGTGIQQCASGRTKLYTASTKPYTTAPNPRQGSWAAKLELWDSDKNCGGSSSTSIRTQVMSPTVMKNGGEYWVSESVYFPIDFPVVQDWWFMFTELYNPLGGGIPPVAFYVQKTGTVIRFAGDYDAGTKGTHPLADFAINKGHWHDFTLHIKVSTNPSVGFLELWHNGQNVQLKGATLVNGIWRVVGQTMLSNHATSGMGLFPNNYRSTSYTTSTGKTIVYFDRIRIGTSRSAVEGSSTSMTPLVAARP